MTISRATGRSSNQLTPMGRQALMLLLVAALLAACSMINAGTENLRSPVPALRSVSKSPTALMLAVQDGLAGERSLREWADFAEHAIFELPPIWVICSDNSAHAALVEELAPHLRPFGVAEGTSWATVLSIFRDQNTLSTVFGLLGEGVLPPADLHQSIISVEQALHGTLAPTAVVTRSRSSGDAENPPYWLPDTFIAQIWCNRAMLTGSGFEDEGFHDSTLLELLPKFLHAHSAGVRGAELVVADGTNFVASRFDADGASNGLVGNEAAADGGALYIGTSEVALVRVQNADGVEGADTSVVSIGTALWPPPYVLETAVLENGLVIVNNVNCGYLDFAVNFLLAAQKVVSGIKVLWVAMDETSFDFMDNLAPGCAAMFPSEDSARHHATAAGRIGGDTFKSQVLIRPKVLLHVLNQGYTLLWTDSDMVWLGNPLPLLPDMNAPEAAEVMLQSDGSKGNPCTCFMFMKPTELAKGLLVEWIQAAEETDAKINQIVFRGPLHKQRDSGMRLEFFPPEKFPSGKYFFENPFEDNYARIHYEEILIVHNNYIKGHGRKLDRFKAYHLWDVAGHAFPSCEADATERANRAQDLPGATNDVVRTVLDRRAGRTLFYCLLWIFVVCGGISILSRHANGSRRSRTS